MSDLTRLDAAHAAMEAAPEDEGARLDFYAQLAASELFLLLDKSRQMQAAKDLYFKREAHHCKLRSINSSSNH